MNLFNPIACALTGNHLLDASAGTGKTYSLSFLYLRLIIEQELSVRDVLVTTFTRAAVAELKGRIYEVLGEAEVILHGQALNAETKPDATLAEYLNETFTDERARYLACKRLQLARAEFEQAQIFTIDGYFLQVIQQHALTLGTYQPEHILTNDTEMIKAVFFDLARHEFNAVANPELTAKILVDFSPKYLEGDTDSIEDKLCKELAKIIEHSDYFHRGITSEADYASQIRDLEAEQQAMTAQAAEIHATLMLKLDLLLYLVEEKKLNGNKFRKNTITTIQASLTDANVLLSFDGATLPNLAQRIIDKDGFKDSLSGAEEAKLCDGFFETLLDFLAKKNEFQDRPKHLVFGELAWVIEQRLAEEKSNHLAHTYLDMTKLVAKNANSGNLVASHTTALIDEAQDTNSAQIDVFRSLFFEPKDKHAFFVGDVKQAIYKFRGANVHAYETVKATLENQHRLGTNYRSNQSLNDSVNYLFSGLHDFPYAPVESNRDNKDIDHAGIGLTVVETNDNAEEAHVNATISVVLDYLSGKHHINGVPVQHKDIAILIHNRTQGKAIRHALLAHGISASYSARQQVFHSDEAMWLYTLLNAWLTPKSSYLRAILVSPLFRLSVEEIQDNARLDSLRELCLAAQHEVERRGIIVALAKFMHAGDVSHTLLRQIDGRRRLTNLLHLAELLDEKGTSLFGLIDTLNRHMNADDPESELRIDNDETLTIETIHGSKGLEYPIVILPFFSRGSAGNADKNKFMVSHTAKLAGFGFSHIPELFDAYTAEEADEHYRQVYVALTRAKYRNVMIVGERKPANKNDSQFDNSDWVKLRLQNRQAELYAQDFCETMPPPDVSDIHIATADNVEFPTLHELPADRDLSPEWLLDSFSKLNSRYEHEQHSENDSSASDDKAIPTSALLNFPRGINPGHTMHELFEKVMETRDLADIPPTLAQLCEKYKLDVDNTAALAKDFANIVKQPFLPNNQSMFDIEPAQQSIEMAFYLHLSPSARVRLLQQFGDTVTESTINGFINGHIDYMFCLDGKYYVLDYKSNHLGNEVSDYHHDAMLAEMHHHRYDLQALIYTIALTKHLQNTLPDFDYDTHMGGYYYLFVRGMQDGSDTGVFYDRVDWDELQGYLV